MYRRCTFAVSVASCSIWSIVWRRIRRNAPIAHQPASPSSTTAVPPTPVSKLLRHEQQRDDKYNRFVNAVHACMGNEQVGPFEQRQLGTMGAHNDMRRYQDPTLGIGAFAKREHNLIRAIAQRLQTEVIERRVVVEDGTQRHVDERAMGSSLSHGKSGS